MAPPHAVPPTLPPSVEESYRRKCIQLKQRMNEVEEANAASILRLQRMHRGIEKLRLERGFLLEQLAKRTSTNVEDSEGSPSPPPTPKEKPLRTKRGHRKPSFLANLESGRGSMSAFPTNPSGTAPSMSPSSEAFSHSATTSQPQAASQSTPSAVRTSGANGTSGLSHALSPISEPPKKARNAFELYANETRSVLTVQHRRDIKEGSFDVNQEVALQWQRLGSDGQEEWQLRYEREKEEGKARREAEKGGGPPLKAEQSSANGAAADEDVEMAEDATVEDEK